jgi:4-amino-4-deoxy-L-arabinose transferase-like glycosyltransferase
MTQQLPARALHWLLLPAVALLFLGLGANTIWDANEAFYVETPRQMLLSGDYINPSFNGEPRMNKPVLSYWVVAGLYHLFGVSVGVERLGIAFGALGILLAAYLCGRVLRSSLAGWWAVLLVATAPQFVMFSRRIFIDIWVTMFMALTIGCFLLAVASPTRRRLYLVLMYVAIGLGVLTKGPIALVFPAATIGVWLLVERRLSDITTLWLVPGALLVLAINLPWWGAIYAQHGLDPIKAFWLGENLGRYTEAMQPGERDVLFYIPVVIGQLFPWSLFILAGLASGAAALWSRLRPAAARSSEVEIGAPAIRRFLLIWTGLLVGVFSFSESKQDLYVFPILPAVAALAADALLTNLEAGGRRVRWMLGATVPLLWLLGVGLWVLFGGLAPTHHRAGADVLAGTLLAGGLAVAVLVIRHQTQPALLTLAATMVVANYVFALVSLPAVEPFKPTVPMVQTIEARTRPDRPPPVVAHYVTSLPSFVYYLGRPVEDYFNLGLLVARVRTADEMYILMQPAEYVGFEAAVRAQALAACIVQRQTLFEAKMRLVLDGSPWPEVLLVGTGEACSR